MGFHGYSHTSEAREKISLAMKGDTNANKFARSPEERAKRAEARRGKPALNYGWRKPGLEATERPTLRDIAWAAGIYEGEGWCSRVSSGTTTHVGVGQKADDDHGDWLLNRLKALFGGSIYNGTKSGEEVIYRSWNIHGSRARGFLMTLCPFLSPRRQGQLVQVLTISLEQT